MATLQIKGGVKLNGEIPIFGMKNAVLPCIAATLLTDQPVTLRNVPQISDALNMLSIIESLGGTVEWIEDTTVVITNKDLNLDTLDRKKVKSMRSSVLLIGPLLARCKELQLAEPGGCIIGNRPLGDHINVFKAMGAEVHRIRGGLHFKAERLKGAEMYARFSVTGTENALMASATAQGTSVIKLSAREPHVVNLAHMLEAMGARINGIGNSTMTVEGIEALHGCDHTIIPDQIEAGTFIAAAAATRSNITLTNIDHTHMDAVYALMDTIKIPYELHQNALEIKPNGSLHAFKLQTGPYPAFPTDLQAPFGVLATQSAGTSLIHDTMFEGRLGYINELIKMGANATICDPHRVLITGPTPLYAQEIKSLDLRAGATLVIAGLVAEGETIIRDAEILDRGYYKLQERLQTLGAEITRYDPEQEQAERFQELEKAFEAMKRQLQGNEKERETT